MARIFEFDLGDGATVLVNVKEEGSESGPVRSSVGGLMVEKAQAAIGETIGRLRPLTETILTQFRSLPSQPDEIEIEFGVLFNAKFGAIIAEGGAESHVKIAVTWKGRPEEPSV